MKRILLSVVAVAALALSGVFTSSAQAHGPYGNRCCNSGFQGYGYSSGYGGGYGLGGGYGQYGGYSPYNAYRSPFVPYGAGYSGGWQPYQGYYNQQPRFGLQIGF